MSDLVRALAFAFRRKGADAMPGADLRLLLAYDLRWFAPEDAKRVVQRGVELGLLVAEGDALRPSFDVAAVEVPMNFRPTTHVLDEEAPASLPRAAPTRAPPAVASPVPAPPATAPPAAAPPADPHARAADQERRRRGLLVSYDVAQLIVRRRGGEDVREEAARLEAQLLSAGAPARREAP